MKRIFTRQRHWIVVAVVALIIGCFQLGTFWPQPALARVQLPDGSVVFVTSPIVFGITPGQKLRSSLGTGPGSRGTTDVGFTIIVTDTDSHVAFESERIVVPSGEWRFLDVSRGDLNIEGEPGTGRAQGMAQVFIKASRGAKSSDLIGSLEVYDEGTGKTVNHWTLVLPQLEQRLLF